MIINYRVGIPHGDRLLGAGNKISYGFGSRGSPTAPAVMQSVVGNQILQLPVNCVIAGQQPEEKKSRFITDFSGILKNIFRE